MVGSCCAICGVLIISLPIPIIVNTFNKLYEKAKIKDRVPARVIGVAQMYVSGRTPAVKEHMMKVMAKLELEEHRRAGGPPFRPECPECRADGVRN